MIGIVARCTTAKSKSIIERIFESVNSLVPILPAFQGHRLTGRASGCRINRNSKARRSLQSDQRVPRKRPSRQASGRFCVVKGDSSANKHFSPVIRRLRANIQPGSPSHGQGCPIVISAWGCTRIMPGLCPYSALPWPSRKIQRAPGCNGPT